MLTIESEAEKMDERERKVATLATKQTINELVPDGAPDLAFLDNPSLLGLVAQTLKPYGFLLLNGEPSTEAVPGLSLISQKTLPDKTLSFFRKVMGPLTAFRIAPKIGLYLNLSTNFQYRPIRKPSKQ